jgi:hypothetical protein
LDGVGQRHDRLTAKVGGYTVISEETGLASLAKIPGVCNAMKVPCIKLAELIDAEDWALG